MTPLVTACLCSLLWCNIICDCWRLRHGDACHPDQHKDRHRSHRYILYEIDDAHRQREFRSHTDAVYILLRLERVEDSYAGDACEKHSSDIYGQSVMHLRVQQVGES